MNTLFRLPLPVRVVIIAVAWFSYAILVLDLNSLDSGSRSAEPIWTACLVGAALTVVVDLTAAAFVLHPTDWEGVELAMVGAVSSSGWRILHWLLAVAFVVVGVFAFIRPDPTFVGLAAVMSFYFIFRGGFDIAMAIAGSGSPGWWVLLLVGFAQLAIGFWAAGSWKVSVVLLVSWVAAAALMHGIGQISTAFMVRRVGKALAD
ncbi:DUF308 domain-containing protein [Mycobacterium sp.]|uniref:DUF308 domain-containing protein n=1 Tax=Mycobacterium sp. TaxID=1785 RepID=UPI003C732E30